MFRDGGPKLTKRSNEPATKWTVRPSSEDGGRTGLPERLTSLRKPCAAVTRYLAPLWRGAGVPWVWGQRHVRTASGAAYRPHPLPCKAKNPCWPDFFPATFADGRKLPRKLREAQAETPAGRRIGRESNGEPSASGGPASGCPNHASAPFGAAVTGQGWNPVARFGPPHLSALRSPGGRAGRRPASDLRALRRRGLLGRLHASGPSRTSAPCGAAIIGPGHAPNMSRVMLAYQASA
jgi:hypothetical protein